MPFDGTDNTALTNRARLIEALRNSPENFKWDFGTYYETGGCGSTGCALGMAVFLGIVEEADSEVMADAIGISYDDAYRIFEPAPDYSDEDDNNGDPILHPYRCGYDQVTPAMVADEIEKLP